MFLLSGNALGLVVVASWGFEPLLDWEIRVRPPGPSRIPLFGIRGACGTSRLKDNALLLTGRDRHSASRHGASRTRLSEERPMSEMGAVTRWIQQLRAGDREAAQKVWESYFRRLVGLARMKLRDQPRAARDEEDIALSAFDSFFRQAEQGRYPRLGDREDLWRILVTITARKAYDLIEHEGRDKRDWRRTQG